MKTLIALIIFLAMMPLAAQQFPPMLMYDINGNPYPTGSGAPPGSNPPGMTCYTIVAGATVPCVFNGSVGSGTVTNFLAPTISWPSWLTPAVTNPTTTPSLAVAASLIPNSALANPETTVNGQTCTLGSTCTVTAVTPAPPYWTDGTHFYDSDGFQITKPPTSPTWINSVAPASYTVGTNGNAIIITAGTGVNYWLSAAGTTSATAEGRASTLGPSASNTSSQWGVWVYDSTNSKIYTVNISIQIATSIAGNPSTVYWVLGTFNYAGSGNPSFSANSTTILGSANGWGAYANIRAVKSSTTVNFQLSLDGGQTYQTIISQTGVGTIASSGVHIYDGNNAQNLNLISFNVQ